MFFVIPTEERAVGPLEELFEEEDNVGTPELEAILRMGNGHAEIVVDCTQEIIG